MTSSTLAQCFQDPVPPPSDTDVHDYFGASIAINGDFALIGASEKQFLPLESVGAAYIYERDPFGGSAAWTEGQQLTADDQQDNDFFGESVDMKGNVAVVASPGDAVFTGAVYTYRKDASNQWQPDPISPIGTNKLTASDGAFGDRFGGPIGGSHHGVAIDGNLLVIGAPWAEIPDGQGGTYVKAGKVYVFAYNTGNGRWEEKAIITQNPGDDHEFGFAVALDRRKLVVGAPNEGTDGTAYVFRGVTSEVWVLEQTLLAGEFPIPDHNFGHAVAIDDKTILVGAPTSGDPGAAYVFKFDGLAWSNEQALSPADPEDGDAFGYSVDLDGSLAVVGARGHSHPNVTSSNPGSAYVFQRTLGATPWVQALQLYQSNEWAGPPPGESGADRFGEVVAIDGDDVLIGALGDEPPGGIQNGNVFPFMDVPGCP